jgi:hypothetical protein
MDCGVAGEALAGVSVADAELVKLKPEHIQCEFDAAWRKANRRLKLATG